MKFDELKMKTELCCVIVQGKSIVASTAGHRKGHVDLMIGRRVDFWPHGHVMFFSLWLLILAALFNHGFVWG